MVAQVALAAPAPTAPPTAVQHHTRPHQRMAVMHHHMVHPMQLPTQPRRTPDTHQQQRHMQQAVMVLLQATRVLTALQLPTQALRQEQRADMPSRQLAMVPAHHLQQLAAMDSSSTVLKLVLLRVAMVSRLLLLLVLVVQQVAVCGRQCLMIRDVHTITTHRLGSASGRSLRRCPRPTQTAATASRCRLFGSIERRQGRQRVNDGSLEGIQV